MQNFYLMQELSGKVYGVGLRSIVGALIWYTVSALALVAVMSYSFVASKCLVVFPLVKLTGCFYCSFFVMPIVRRRH